MFVMIKTDGLITAGVDASNSLDKALDKIAVYLGVSRDDLFWEGDSHMFYRGRYVVFSKALMEARKHIQKTVIVYNEEIDL